MTVARSPLGLDLVQGARAEWPLQWWMVVALLCCGGVPLALVVPALLAFSAVLHNATAQNWTSFWDAMHLLDRTSTFIAVVQFIPFVQANLLSARAVRRLALLGDNQWTPLAPVQPGPLTGADLATSPTNLGIFKEPAARNAGVLVVLGIIVVLLGAGLIALMFAVVLPSTSGTGNGDDQAAFDFLAGFLVLMAGAFFALGAWTLVRAVRLWRGTRLVDDGDALRVVSAGGRQRATIPWHEMRALTVRTHKGQAGRATYWLDTGERTLSWTEFEFGGPELGERYRYFRRLVVTRTGLPLRNAGRADGGLPEPLRRVVRKRKVAGPVSATVPLDATEEAIWSPVVRLYRVYVWLICIFFGYVVLVGLLNVAGLVLQHTFLSPRG